MASHIPARTKFENLLLTGQNLTVHGAIGVTLIGRGDLLGNSGHGIPRKKNRKRMKRLFKYTLIALAAILVLPAAFLCGLYLTADMEQPAVTIDTAAYRVTNHGGYTTCHGSFLRCNPHGLWELYTCRPPKESGRRQAPSPQG